MTLFLLFFVQLSAAAPDPSGAAIEQAQALAKEKNRRTACRVLVETLGTTPAPAKGARARLTEALAQISRMFFTDKGQRAFEAGQALMFENPDLAMSQFRQALTLEDDNVVVLDSIVKVQLIKQDCDGAMASVEKARALNPTAAEPAVLELRALLCGRQFGVVKEKAKQMPALDKWEEQYVQYILAQAYLHEKSPKRAFDVLLRLSEEQTQFPETFLWLARAAGELSKDNESWLRKYISLCKGVDTKERRRYSLEPRLCSGLKEAEDELAKKTSD